LSLVLLFISLYFGSHQWKINMIIRPKEFEYTLLIQDELPNLSEISTNLNLVGQLKNGFDPNGKCVSKLTMYAWEGNYLILLTHSNDFDFEVIKNFIKKLDDGWNLFSEFTAYTPIISYQDYNFKPTIAALKDISLTKNFSNARLGINGIEVCGFYNLDYRKFKEEQSVFSHYYFYEMGRCFYCFDVKFNTFATGFAVFMRYICMEQLNCTDTDIETKSTIMNLESKICEKDLDFETLFSIRLKLNGETNEHDDIFNDINPSDLPAFFASIMLYLRNEYGGNIWVKKFFRELIKRPKSNLSSDQNTIEHQSNWIVATSLAAKQNLLPLFINRWNLKNDSELYKIVNKELNNIDFDRLNITPPNFPIITPALTPKLTVKK